MSLGDAACISSLSHPLAPVVKSSHLIQTTAVASDPPSSLRLKGDARDVQPRYRGWVRAELGLGWRLTRLSDQTASKPDAKISNNSNNSP